MEIAFSTPDTVLFDKALAREIREYRSPTDGETRMFYEIVIAPRYSGKGLEILRGKSKNLRILEAKKSEKGMMSLKQVSGGWLVQDSDDLVPVDINFNVVSKKIPTEEELSDAEFAWLCVKHVKSNAIVIAKVGVPFTSFFIKLKKHFRMYMTNQSHTHTLMHKYILLLFYFFYFRRTIVCWEWEVGSLTVSSHYELPSGKLEMLLKGVLWPAMLSFHSVSDKYS